MSQVSAPSDKEVIKTNCPRDCYDSCGMVVIRKNGKIAKVLGDKEHALARGALCSKCALAYNGAWIDPQARLQHPLKRIGKKGEGRFKQVSWEEALSDIATHLVEIRDTHGGEKIIHTHYTGTCSLLGMNLPLRFFNAIGATEVDPDTVCNKAGHVALSMILGSSMDGFDPRSAKDTDCLVIWGANPSACAPHVHKYWIPETQRHAKIIVIDPIAHDTAKMADIHLQPRPGTDAALAFAILNVLAGEGKINRQFLADHVLGWEEVESQIDVCTPEWGEQQTGVPADRIIEAARAFGAGRSMMWLGQGLQRQVLGSNVIRACSLLPIATGNLGKPGTGILYLNGFGSRGVNVDDLLGTELRQTPPAMISHMDLAAHLEDDGLSRALICWNNNIAASSPDQNRLRRALQREDLLHVSIELFATDTTDFADYVLPAANFLEFNDLTTPYFEYTVGAQVKVAEPMGESLPNQEIFRRLARAMDLQVPALYESDEMLINRFLEQMLGGRESFDSLALKGSVYWTEEPVIRFADYRFNTPSGKIEVASETFVSQRMSCAPAPVVDLRPLDGRLRVLSPGAEYLMNSSYANVVAINRKMGMATVWLHPEEAQKRQLTDGMDVLMHNATGRLPVRLALSDRVPMGVAYIPKGRWPKQEASGANINFLNPGLKTDLADSHAVHNVEAWIEPLGANKG